MHHERTSTPANTGCQRRLSSTNVHLHHSDCMAVVPGPVALWPGFTQTHGFPLVADVLGREVGVGVHSGQLDSVGLSDLQDLAVDAQRGHALLVRLGQSGLELVVSSDQALGGAHTGFRASLANRKCRLSAPPPVGPSCAAPNATVHHVSH